MLAPGVPAGFHVTSTHRRGGSGHDRSSWFLPHMYMCMLRMMKRPCEVLSPAHFEQLLLMAESQ